MHPTDEQLNRPGGLAERLYSMRKAAGLTGDRMAKNLSWPRSKISKVENGRQMPSPSDIRAWTEQCGFPAETQDLLDLLSDIQAVHRQWQMKLRRGQDTIQEDLDRRTREAHHIREAQILLIPGLLQTGGYARSIMTEVAAVYGTRGEDVEASVTARMKRQEVLYDQAKTFQFVTTQAALHTLVCPPQVMLGQLDRLLSVGLDNVTLGIIPLDTKLEITPLHGFLMLDNQASIETYGAEITAGEDESAAYGRIFDKLMAEALTGDDARQLMMEAARALREK